MGWYSEDQICHSKVNPKKTEEPLCGVYADDGKYIRVAGAAIVKMFFPQGLGYAEPKRMITPDVKQALQKYKYKLSCTDKNGTEWYETKEVNDATQPLM